MASKQYRYSFSGADARAFVYYPGFEDLLHPLESLHTISVSVHEAKGQARALGYRSIRGIARGTRTIAGSMILTVIEDHPLRELMEQAGTFAVLESSSWGGWSLDRMEMGTGSAFDRIDFKNRMETLIPPFNMYLQYMSEASNFKESTAYYQNPYTGAMETREAYEQPIPVVDFTGAAMLLESIEFIDSGIVTSINDVVSEVTLSFIARDFKPLTKNILHQQNVPALPSSDQQRHENFLKQLFGRDYDRKLQRQNSRELKQLHQEFEKYETSPEDQEIILKAWAGEA